MLECKVCKRPVAHSTETTVWCPECVEAAERQLTLARNRIRDALANLADSGSANLVLHQYRDLTEAVGSLAALAKKGLLNSANGVQPLLADTIASRDGVLGEVIANSRRGRGGFVQIGEPPPAPTSGKRTTCTALGALAARLYETLEWLHVADSPGEPPAQAANRRRHPRRRTQIFIQLDPGAVPSLSEDLSEGGVFAGCLRLLPPGSRLEMTLHTTTDHIKTPGIVRWLRREADPDTLPVGMGIEFAEGPLTLAV